MARRKEITRDKILETAYKMAIKTGVESLTARSIAKTGRFSTQPIYLEFANMNDLREQVLIMIAEELKQHINEESYTGNPLIDLDLSYINFAQSHTGVFRAMFVDGKFGSRIIADTLLDLGVEKFQKEYPGQTFTRTRMEHIVIANWISATGISALLMNNIANFSQDQVVNVLNAQIHDAILNDHLSETKDNSMFAEGQNASLKDRLA